MKLLFLLLLIPMLLGANNREKYNFNSQWLLHIGDVQGGEKLFFTDKDWNKITLPRAFNGIVNILSYRKQPRGKKYL